MFAGVDFSRKVGSEIYIKWPKTRFRRFADRQKDEILVENGLYLVSKYVMYTFIFTCIGSGCTCGWSLGRVAEKCPAGFAD